MTKKPLIISTDPGIDDIAAMTISLFADELDVRLIVPTWGNVALKYTVQNTLNLEKFLYTKVPVVVGANQPLVAPMISAASVHGETGIAGFELDREILLFLDGRRIIHHWRCHYGLCPAYTSAVITAR